MRVSEFKNPIRPTSSVVNREGSKIAEFRKPIPTPK
ncbi:MAG: hypothetical protein ACJASM_002928 [Salibacteraceae bacterium]|jgi:hypothetical protein